MYNYNVNPPPEPPREQCPHCGTMDAQLLVGVSLSMPWGFFECRSKAGCRERREANLASDKPRRCGLCGYTRWLYGGGERGPRHIRCLDKDGCRLRVAQAKAPAGVTLIASKPGAPVSERVKPAIAAPKRRNRPNPTIAPAVAANAAPAPAAIPIPAAQAAREARELGAK